MGIQDFYMEVKPRKVGLQATYIFHFTIEKKVEVHQSITLVWPPGTTINPPLPEDPKERNERLKQIIESMSIGLSPCSSCQGLPIIETDKQGFLKLTFNTHIELNPDIPGYKNIYVTVPDRCGFTNPQKAGTYTFKVATLPEPEYKSTTFDIVDSKTSTPQVTVDPPIYNMNAQYKIEFNVGAGGWLGRGIGLIKIRFPQETKFQKPISEIKPEFITVNGKPLGKAPNGSKNLINFPTPVEIQDDSKVIVILDKRTGIINPPKVQKYQLEVATSIDTEWVKSEPYSIQRGVAMLEIEPPKVNRIAQYKISFVLDNGQLAKGGGILISFPKTVFLPKTIDSKNILVNEKHSFAVTLDNGEVTVFTDVEINPMETVEIVFTKECGIRNPKDPEKIKIEFKPQNYNSFEETSSVEITEAKLEIQEITIKPPNAYSSAQYEIDFILGDKGGLIKGQKIYLDMENSYSDSLSKVNKDGVKLKSEELPEELPIELQIEKTSLVITCQTKIASATILTLSIELRNPVQNEYQIRIKTDAEPNIVTATYTILPPLPMIDINISGGKKGNQGWYIEPPVIGFSCSDPEAKILVFWDDHENQIEYSGKEMPLETGQYIARLNYYAENPYGKSAVKITEFKVDTEKPIVVIESPKEKITATNNSSLEISGRITPMKTVIYGKDTMTLDKIVVVNNRQLSVNDEGGFKTAITLKNEKTNIVIEVQDEAGNSVFQEFVVFYDPIPPKLEILNPKNNDWFLLPKVTVKGLTEPDVQLLINGEIVFVENDGSFTAEIIFPDIGQQVLHLEATDKIGNTSEIQIEIRIGYIIFLKIGQKKATVNDEEKILDAPPYIKNGRTLVPFRFIGEALKAQISYSSNSSGKVIDVNYYLKNELGTVYIKLIIGSNIALVNEKKVVLDVPPEIKNGRTFVPVRFVSENLGAQVEWNTSNQTIILKYPKI